MKNVLYVTQHQTHIIYSVMVVTSNTTILCALLF